MESVINFVLSNSQHIAYLSSAFGIVFIGLQFGLKLRAEKRLKQSSQIESEIKLINLFCEVMNLAHARKSTVLLSDTLLKQIDKIPYIKKTLIKDNHGEETTELPFVTYPVGLAAQIAAMSSIYELGKNHLILRNAAIEGLKQLHSDIDSQKYPTIHSLTEQYFKKLEYLNKFTILIPKFRIEFRS
jgi:hypothetical protein